MLKLCTVLLQIIQQGDNESFFIFSNNYSFYNNKLADFSSGAVFFYFEVQQKIAKSKEKKMFSSLPRATIPSANVFSFFGNSDNSIANYDEHRKTPFFEAFPEIHCHLHYLPCFSMKIYENIVQMLKYDVKLE